MSVDDRPTEGNNILAYVVAGFSPRSVAPTGERGLKPATTYLMPLQRQMPAQISPVQVARESDLVVAALKHDTGSQQAMKAVCVFHL